MIGVGVTGALEGIELDGDTFNNGRAVVAAFLVAVAEAAARLAERGGAGRVALQNEGDAVGAGALVAAMQPKGKLRLERRVAADRERRIEKGAAGLRMPLPESDAGRHPRAPRRH